jgi:hypothetical protein
MLTPCSSAAETKQREASRPACASRGGAGGAAEVGRGRGRAGGAAELGRGRGGAGGAAELGPDPPGGS